LVLLPQLKLAFDPGRAHRSLPPMSTLVLSHGHMDHLGALGYWASQRHLNTMGPGTLVVPHAIAPKVMHLLQLYADLEGGQPYLVDLVSVVDGDHYNHRKDFELTFFATDHWVPTLGATLTWRRRRLRPEFAGLSGEEIAHLRKSGQSVTEERRVDLASYCADSGPALFKNHPEVLRSEVLFVEVSFFRPADRARAARYGHLHLEGLVAVSESLRCRHLVLLHASRRHRLRDVEAMLDQHLRPHLDCVMHHLNVDWD